MEDAMNRGRIFLVILLALTHQICINNNLNATTLVYTDASDWLNSFTSNNNTLTHIDFENATETFPNSKYNNISSDGISIEEQYNGAGGLSISNANNYISNGKLVYFFFNNAVTISLPNNVYAFGFDLGNCDIYNNSPPIVKNAIFSTGEMLGQITGSAPPPSFSFFGFTSDVAISSFSFQPGNTLDALLDNFVYAQQAQPSPVPEPGTILLFGTGLVGLVGAKFRRKEK